MKNPLSRALMVLGTFILTAGPLGAEPGSTLEPQSSREARNPAPTLVGA